jgi:hypothetical protein
MSGTFQNLTYGALANASGLAFASTNDSSADNSTGINGYLVDAAAIYNITAGRGIGGKEIRLPQGDIYIKSPIKVTRGVKLSGQGKGTRIIAATDFVGNRLIELQRYEDTDNIAESFTLSDFTLDGNKSGQSVSVAFSNSSGDLLCTKATHGLQNGDKIKFNISGKPSTILANFTTYYVVSAAADTFKVSLTAGGTAILVGDGAGKTGSFYPLTRDGIFFDITDGETLHTHDVFGTIENVHIENCSRHGIHFPITQQVVTFNGTTNVVTCAGHGFYNGDIVYFSGGTLPTGLAESTAYYIVSKSVDTFKVSAILGGDAIDFTGNGSGTTYVQTRATTASVASACIFQNVFVNWCGEDGIHCHSSDNFWNNVNSYGNYRGLYLNGGNQLVSNVKTYYNENYGMHIASSGVGCKLSNIECQEEQAGGLYLAGCDNVQVTNVVVEAAGHNGAGTDNSNGVGIVLDGCKNCRVTGNVGNRPSLAGTMQYATKWVGTGASAPKGNVVELSVTDTSYIKPIAAHYDTLPPITNRLTINDMLVSLPNIFDNCPRLFGDSNADGKADGFQTSSQTGITATYSYDATELCQKVNVTTAGRAVTFTNATDVVNLSTHGFSAGTIVQFNTVGAMPTGLSANTNYYVRAVNTNDFKVATTNSDATIVDFSTDGTGTIYVQDLTKAALVYYELPVTAGDIISVAMQCKVESGLSYKLGINYYSGSPSSSSYLTNTSGNAMTSQNWDWTTIQKHTVPANTTFARIQIQILANAAGVQDLDAYFRNLIVTLESVRNKTYIMKWGASPHNEFIPRYAGQLCLDTVNSKFYAAINNVAKTDWVALN